MSMAGRWLVRGLLVAVFAQINTAGAQTFPRLGGYLIGGNTTPLTPAHVAVLDVVILGAYEGWTSNGGLNASQFAAAAKAINPNLKLFVYTDTFESSSPPSPSDTSPIANASWFLHPSGDSGSLITSYSPNYVVNLTTYSKVYNGQNYPTWRAQRDVGKFITGFPNVDGIFADGVFSIPRWDGDYTLSGSSQSHLNSTTQHIYRLGYVAYFNAVRAASPSSQQMISGNVADWYTNGQGYADVSDYQGVLNSGVMESIIPGQENNTGWAGVMAMYTTVMNALAAPKLAIFNYDGTSTTDYQGFRYGLASCMLGDGYFYYHIGQGSGYNDYVTFDEYSVNLGNAQTSALVFPGATAWQKGVYRRDFDNGIALVNPKGNGPQTVTLETSYKHISGTQDPSVNNGQTVTSVTLNDRDGVILLRLTSTSPPPPAVPQAPSQVTVH